MSMKMRRRIFLGLWLLSLTAISFYGGAVSYGFFWGITLIPVISLLYLGVVHFQLRILQQIESRNMVCGQPVPYFFVLQNDSRCVFAGISVKLFSSFSTVEDLPGDTEYELLPGDKFTFHTKLICRYRGEYEVGVKEIVMTDFFRLLRIRYRIPGAIKALVRPRIIRVAGLRSADNLTLLMRRDSPREQTEPDAIVRDYIPGDALRQVHWKAAAREQKLKVRNRIGEEKQGIALLWDTRRYSRKPEEYLPVENRILETVLALGIFMAERNIPFWACHSQRKISGFPVEGLKDFDGFYQRVSEVQFDEAGDFGQILLSAGERGLLSESRVVFCVIHELTESILKTADQWSRAGMLTVLYVVTDEEAEDLTKQGNERLRIICIPTLGELEGRL